MRVATRRMRAAWRVFGDASVRGASVRWRSASARSPRSSGPSATWTSSSRPPRRSRVAPAGGERSGLEPLLDGWRSERDRDRRRLVRELDLERHRRFVEEFRAFVLTTGDGVRPVDPTVPHRVRDTAGSRIMLAFEHVRAYEPVLRWADVATLHQLRIAAKRLRYTLEFVREALGPEAPALIDRVVALQDHLGLMNDAEVARNAGRAFLLARGSTLDEPPGRGHRPLRRRL